MLAQYKDTKVQQKIIKALRVTSGNKTAAAKLCGITRGQFYRALNEMNWLAKDDGKVQGNAQLNEQGWVDGGLG